MFGFGAEELLLILVIILVLFGGKKLPELSRSIAQAFRELRGGFTEDPHKSKPESSERKQQP